MGSVRVRTAALVIAALGAAGCGSSGAGAGEQACLDLADTLGSDAQRCGLDYQTNYDAIVGAVAGGDCANITSLRDHDSFYGECLPFLRNLTCEEVNSTTVTFPASCKAQLVR
jgi:hypothetical protein